MLQHRGLQRLSASFPTTPQCSLPPRISFSRRVQLAAVWPQSSAQARRRSAFPPRASALSVWKIQYHGTVRAQHSTAQYGTARTIYCSSFAAAASGPVGSEVLASLFSFPFPGARDDVAVLRPKRTSTSPSRFQQGSSYWPWLRPRAHRLARLGEGDGNGKRGSLAPAARPSNRGAVYEVHSDIINNDGSPMPFATVPYRTIPRARPSPSAQQRREERQARRTRAGRRQNDPPSLA
jgi:hypothetical protein